MCRELVHWDLYLKDPGSGRIKVEISHVQTARVDDVVGVLFQEETNVRTVELSAQTLLAC